MSAKTPALSTVPHPLGKPGGPGLFRIHGLMLDPYIENIARALMRNGHSESNAIQLAIAAVKRWARGGGKVSPEVRAAAAKAVAAWEAAKAAAHSHANDAEAVELGTFNSALHPHVASGPAGGQFAPKGSGTTQSQPKPAKGKKTPAGHAAGSHAARPGQKPGLMKPGPVKPGGMAGKQAQARSLRQKAAGLRAQARDLDAQARALAKQHTASAASAKKAAAAAAGKTATKKNLPTKHKVATAKKTAAKKTVVQRIASLRSRATTLRMRAATLDSRAKKLLLSNDTAAVELAYRVPAGKTAGGQFADHCEPLHRHSSGAEIAAVINAMDGTQRAAAHRMMPMAPPGFAWRGDRLEAA